MSIVLAVKEWAPKDGGDPRWYVTLDDKTDNVPCYDPAAAHLVIHDPLPENWTIATSKAGKVYLSTPNSTPKTKKPFEAAFRNTKEGQAVEQERMDRRTALMQAVTYITEQDGLEDTLNVANQFYTWLRQTSGAAPAASDKGDGAVATSSPPNSSPKQVMDGHGEEEVDGGVGVDGEDTPAPPKAHEHQWIPSPRLKSFDVCVVEGCYETKKRMTSV